MGSFTNFERPKIGFLNSPNANIQQRVRAKYTDIVDKDFIIGDIFNVGTGSLLTANEQIPGEIKRVSVKTTDNGILGNYDTKNNHKARHFENVVSVNFFGNSFYHPYKASFDMKVHTLKLKNHEFTSETGIYFASVFNHRFEGQYSYGSQLSSSKLKNENLTLSLPAHINGEIAFDYMIEYIKELEAERIKELEAERIKELEAYLIATGLNDYILTEDEKKLVNDFKNDKTVRWGTFKISELFDHIVQGRRLKKDDQLPGELPFVMSGTTNTGIANYISNDVRIFPANSLTVDIFGSVFYRNYEYGMGDDTGAYWNSDNHISKYGLLFIGVAIEKSLLGQYNYGYKLRSSKSLDKEIQLPVKSDAKPDFDKMNAYIRAIEKMVIKGVIEWKDKQIAATTNIVNNTSY